MSGGKGSSSMSSGAPCGACKFLRRKCIKGCIFAPYFGSDQGAARFAAVHKIFGASNVSKLLLRIPIPELRREAVLSIFYEAQARISDPIYGCVATIFALEQQVANLQAELAFVQAQLASRLTAAAFQQQQLQYIGSLASSSTTPTPYVNNLTMSVPCMANNSGCSYGGLKDKAATVNVLSYEPGMSPPGLESFTSSQDADIAQKMRHSVDQQSDVIDGELQALARVLLQRT